MVRRTVFRIMLALLLTSVFALTSNIQPTRAVPRTWTVDDDGPADFHTIQEALNASSDGDTVFVHNGTYYENVDVRSNVSLVGENRIGAVIDGNGTWNLVHELWVGSVVRLWATSNVTGFTIRNGGYGIEVRTFNLVPTFTGNRIEGNRIEDNHYGAVCLRGCANNTIANNIIANNTLFGIHLYHAGSNRLVNNTIAGNGLGIDFYGNTNNNILRNNNMTENGYNFGPTVRGETVNWMFGSDKPGLHNDVDTSNTVNGKPIYYWVSRNNEQVPLDAGYVWLNNCTDITIDKLNMSGNLQGVLLHSTNNTSISNCTIDNNACGIYLFGGTNNTIVGNTLNDNWKGIYPGDFSTFTTMRNNSINGGQMNFGIPPEMVSFYGRDPLVEFLNDIDVSNTVDGKPIIYWMNQHDQKVPTDAGCVILINCTNILVEDLSLSKNVQGVLAVASNNTIISNNSINGTVYAIDVKGYSYWVHGGDGWLPLDYTSFNTTVKRNIIADNGVGMRITSSSSIITNNTVLRDPLGIYLPGTFGTIISGNLVNGSDQWSIIDSPGRNPDFLPFFPEAALELSYELHRLEVGAMILGGSYNLVQGNTLANSFFGISTASLVEYGSGNLIFHNNLINDTYPGGWSRAYNFWNTVYPWGGNYWSDYNGTDLYSGPYQNETESDGIGDQPYVIDQISVDEYPLMHLYVRVTGDINDDRIVDIYDAIFLATAFSSVPNDPDWNANADFNGDNLIDIFDAIILANNFGETS